MELRLPTGKHARSIVEANAWLNIWHGAVRSGKTIDSLLKWADVVSHASPGRELWMVGKTLSSLERNALRPLEKILGTRAVQVRLGSRRALIYGKRVDLLSANNVGAEEVIRGATVGDAYGDEITLWPECVFLMLISRLSYADSKFYGTTNPAAPKHWLKAKFLDREREPFEVDGKTMPPGTWLRSWHFRLTDNPTLSPIFVASLKRSYTGLWYKRYIDGLWVAAQGAIWDQLDRSKHCVPVPAGLEFTRYMAAVDYGTTNPFVAGLFGRAADGRWWLIRRYRWDSHVEMRQKTDAEYSRDLRALLTTGPGGVPLVQPYKPDVIWCDPSAASFIVQARKDGLPVKPADNAVEDGCRYVATLIANDGLRVADTDDCRGWFDEAEGYVWDEKHQARGEDVPLKEHDHDPDMLRYGLFSESQSPHAGLIDYYRGLAAQSGEQTA